MNRPSPRWATVAVAVLAALPFLPALAGGFLAWDDDVNLLRNPHFRGLGIEQVKWAFTTTLLGPYQPLTWLSFGLDHAIWGMNPFGYHLTNVVVHGLAAAALFACVRRLVPVLVPSRAQDAAWCTGAAATASLVWAVHPLRVESVAWVTERRDVLSGLFLFLSLRAWLDHVRAEDGNRRAYVASVAWFAASLLSKATAMGWPLILLVLDVWPLRRGPRLREKIPFAVLVVAVAVAAWSGQTGAGAFAAANDLGLLDRVVVAAHAAGFYLVKTLVPVALRAHYARALPFEPTDPAVLLPAVAALAICAVVLWRLRRSPGPAVAWAAFLLLLAPVSGLVPVGAHLVAERYTYLCAAPVSVAVGLLVVCRLGVRSTLVAPLLLAVLAAVQCTDWRTTEDLFANVLRHEPDNWMALEKLGRSASQAGRLDEAADLLGRSVAQRGDVPDTLVHLAWVEERRGRAERAAELVERALDLAPQHADAWNTLGLLRARRGDIPGAEAAFRKAVEFGPDHSMAHHNLAELVRPRDPAEADRLDRRALEIDPGNVKAHESLGR